jgi:hypothetical protein
MRNKIAVASLALLSFTGVTAAHADTKTDLGSVYTLSYSSGGGDVYDVTLQINASGFNGTGATSSSDFLNDVALKIVPQTSDITNIAVLMAPSGYASSTVPGGLNANTGCDGSGTGFFCLAYTGSGEGKPVGSAGDIYTFEFAVTVPVASDLLTGTNASSIKVGYLTPTGGNAGITSIDMTLSPGGPSPMPEPSSIALLGTALVGAAAVVRRRLTM